MTNNIKQILPLLDFPKLNDFYFLQIIKRKKDNPDADKSTSVIDNYCINSVDHLQELMPRIIEQCNLNNARAYLRLNVRNYEKIALYTMRKITEYLCSHDYAATRNAYYAVCGECHSDEHKKWIVDVDGDESQLKDVVNYILELQVEWNTIVPKSTNGILCILPTKNGSHLITNPFPLYEFRKKYPNIDVHKDNPTILYCQ